MKNAILEANERQRKKQKQQQQWKEKTNGKMPGKCKNVKIKQKIVLPASIHL